MQLRSILSVASLALLTACAAQNPADPQAVNDPLEGMNRQVHAFNKGLNARVIRPLADAAGGSDGAEGGEGPLSLVANVGSNLSLPGKVLNQVLQGRPEPALRNTLRFVVNSTLGLGGIHDPAGREFKLTEIDTDFGETLYVWGLPEGPYLELPVLGPSTTRRTVGRVVDMVIDPVDNWLNPDQARGATVARLISKAGEKAQFGDTINSVLTESADSYAQARLLYLMHSRHELEKKGGADDGYVIDPYDADAAGGDSFVIDPYDDPAAAVSGPCGGGADRADGAAATGAGAGQSASCGADREIPG